jgi:hypothetical protein
MLFSECHGCELGAPAFEGTSLWDSYIFEASAVSKLYVVLRN